MDWNRAAEHLNGANFAATLGILTFNILLWFITDQLKEIYNNDDTTTLEIPNKVDSGETEELDDLKREKGRSNQTVQGINDFLI